MADNSYEATMLRAALRSLANEVYFKSTHFAGLKKEGLREWYDLASQRLSKPDAVAIGGPSDPFVNLLKELADLSDASPDLLQQWQRVESTLNARVRAIFGLLGAEGSTNVLGQVSEILRKLPALSVRSGRSAIDGKRSDARLGQPDVVLESHAAIVTIEMKVRGGSSARYGPEQHLKYLRIAAEREAQASDAFQSVHLFLAPLQSSDLVSNRSGWLRGAPEDGRPLDVDLVRMFGALPAKRQEQVNCLGGMNWLLQRAARTPTLALDLQRFLRGVEDYKPGDESCATEIHRQVEAVRHYGI
ncbi:MAG: hypothetical protein JJE51_12685 [Thermoanaerobaculia bacterium]|nr:hypothetical protein [Thermoanaerobaculia bacterium]